jgi:hypothetical protein
VPTCDDIPPHVRGSDTSRAAAVAIAPRVLSQREQLLAFIRGRGAVGATDEECQQCGLFPANTQRPRRVELLRAGKIRRATFTRTTNAGRAAVVYVAVEAEGGAP